MVPELHVEEKYIYPSSRNFVGLLGPVVQLVSCLMNLVFVTVVGTQELLGHLIHISDTGAEVIHLRFQSVEPAAINNILVSV